jgi:hypothetical protein
LHCAVSALTDTCIYLATDARDEKMNKARLQSEGTSHVIRPYKSMNEN